MIDVTFSKAFKKKRKKVSNKIRTKVDERLFLFNRNPTHPLLRLHALSGDRKGQWSINVSGDWRAIFVYEDEQSIIFIDLDTHSNLYK